MKKNENICRDLVMADKISDNERNETIDILIGNDYYKEIVKAEKMKIDQHLYLMNSSLGWMFSGQIGGSSMDSQEINMLVDESDDVFHPFRFLSHSFS